MYMQRSRNWLYLWSDRSNEQRTNEKIYWPCRICTQDGSPDRRCHLPDSACDKKIMGFFWFFCTLLSKSRQHYSSDFFSRSFVLLLFSALERCERTRKTLQGGFTPSSPALIRCDKTRTGTIFSSLIKNSSGRKGIGFRGCVQKGTWRIICCIPLLFPEIHKKPVNPTLTTRGSARL